MLTSMKRRPAVKYNLVIVVVSEVFASCGHLYRLLSGRCWPSTPSAIVDPRAKARCVITEGTVRQSHRRTVAQFPCSDLR